MSEETARAASVLMLLENVRFPCSKLHMRLPQDSGLQHMDFSKQWPSQTITHARYTVAHIDSESDQTRAW